MAAKTRCGAQGLGDNMKAIAAVFATAMVVNVASAQAQGIASQTLAEFVFGGVELNIRTGSKDAAVHAERFAALQPTCDPQCVAPYSVAEEIETLSEADVFAFLENKVGKNEGLMVDARMPDMRQMGAIPGSVSLPAQTLSTDNEFRDEILKALGARAFEGVFNFADAQSLVVFDSGPTQNDAGVLIGHLLDAGYPTDKIRYYRGGMQVWSVLGLTIQEQ